MKGLRLCKEIPSLGLLLGVLFAICSVGFSLKINPNGGYDLVVAIEEGTATPSVGQVRYIQNVKNSLTVFSNQLWRATKKQFFINSVELLVPSTWDASVGAEVAALNNYQNADFRLSENITYPRAENPNLCGLPGKFVELPLPFFETANSNNFGPIWKTLMVLFARYRYGVWEEHGYIGDVNYPYFNQNSTSRQWEVTGCSNEPLVGTFINANDKEECTIDWSTPGESVNACRFVPDRVNNIATTSLMHFHWMDSVVDFCDSTTHNRFANNKQNVFCDHKSIMEVIRGSPDYLAVTSPVAEEVPAITFKTVTQSSSPVLYLLIDRGSIQGSYEIATKVPIALARYFQRADFADKIGAIGSYPSGQLDRVVREEVAWSQIGQNLEAFLTAIGTLRADGPMERDFSHAILEVTRRIKEQNHPQGAVLVVVKYGADLNNLNKTASEAEVIVALNEQNIMMHTIELAITGQPLKSHLAQAARATDGSYSTLSTVGEAELSVNNVMNFVTRALNGDYTNVWKNRRTIDKRSITPTSNNIQIPVKVPSNSTNLEVFYTTEVKLDTSNFTLSLNNTPVDSTQYRFYRTNDWNEADGLTKFTYRFRVEAANLVGVNALSVTVNCTSTCGGSAFTRAEFDKTNGGENDDSDSNVLVEVSTTGNNVDLAQGPMILYVKVTKAGAPVGDVAVEALVSNASIVYEYFNIHDDGVAPDVIQGDGIFSAYFAPERDGAYKLSLTVNKNPTALKTISGRNLRESSWGRILPIDQGATGCEFFGNCTMASVDTSFVQVLDLPSEVTVTNALSYAPAPGKSILTYSLIPTSPTLYWFSPRVPGRSSWKADSYEIRTASTRLELLDNFDNCSLVPFLQQVGIPGMIQVLPIPTQTAFYAIKSVFGLKKSERSNIVGVEFIPIPTEEPSTTDPAISTTTPTGPTQTGSSQTGSTSPGQGSSSTTPNPNPTTTPSSGTTSPSPDDDKHWLQTTPGIITIIAVVVAVLLAAGGFYWFVRRRGLKSTYSTA